jgi:GH25 family lysozyme M1 (1,4-beta-N-acetylmuramidase)
MTGGRRARATAAVALGLAITLASSPVFAASAPDPSPAFTDSAPADPNPVYAESAPAGYPVTGIDVSNHQQTVNWGPVAAAGARFAISKATEGLTFIDRYFNANYHGAKNAGLYAGAYHYARPDKSTGTAQADFFLDHAQFADDGRTLPPMLDIEWPWSGSSSPYPCYGLTAAQMVTWIHDFVNEVRARTGRAAMIYTNTNWWKPCTGNDPGFGANPLVISGYTSKPPPLPAGWAAFTFWQYADAGPLPGDQDVFNGSLSALQTFTAARQ